MAALWLGSVWGHVRQVVKFIRAPPLGDDDSDDEDDDDATAASADLRLSTHAFRHESRRGMAAAAFEIIDYHPPMPDMFVDHVRRAHGLPPRRTARREGVKPPAAPSLGSPPSARAVREKSASSGGVPPPPRQATPPPASTSLASIIDATQTVVGGIPDSLRAAHRKFVVDPMERRSTALHWFLYVLIGVSVGAVSALVSSSISMLEAWRSDTMVAIVEAMEQEKGVGFSAGLIFWVATASLFAVFGTAVVCLFEPAAAGSGIPQVMAYLNGVLISKVLNVRTFVAKFASVVMAVSGGLPVGAEAPLIQLGAIVGAGVTQGRSRTLGCSTQLFRAFRTTKDRRDFVTAGAACGVSAAFGAPIGGLLFVMEEVASFWGLEASGQAFLASMVAFFTVALFNTVIIGHNKGYVSSNAAVLFQVEYAGTMPLNIAAVLPAAVLGGVAGMLAALFTRINLGVVRWRRHWSRRLDAEYAAARGPAVGSSMSASVTRVFGRVGLTRATLRRMAEPVIVAAAFAALTYALPLVTPCVPIVSDTAAEQSIANRTAVRAAGEARRFAIEEVNNIANITILASSLDNHSTSSIAPTSQPSVAATAWHTESQAVLATYVCRNRTTHYSPMATLMTSGGKPAIRRLLSRHTGEEFSATTIAVFGTVYFLTAAYINGAALATGMVIPMLVVGSCIGRLFGLLMVYVFATTVRGGALSDGLIAKGLWEHQSWMDPGVFALVGAAAFFGGVSRMTISLTVIVVELSGELHYLLPIMAAIVVAKHTADRLCPPLYHALLHLDAIPYLPALNEDGSSASGGLSDGGAGVPFKAFTIGDLLSATRGGGGAARSREEEGEEGSAGFRGNSPLHLALRPSCVVHVSPVASVVALARMLSSCTHHCFPVVTADGEDGAGRFHGTVSREDLQVLLTLWSDHQKRMRSHRDSADARPPRPASRGVAQEEEELPSTPGIADVHGGSSPPRITFETVVAPRRLIFVPRMTYAEWLSYQSSLFFVVGSRDWHERWTAAHFAALVNEDEEDAAAISTAKRATGGTTTDSAVIAVPHQQHWIDINIIVNRSPWTITANTSLSQAFTVFRTNALRHLVVLGGSDVAVGESVSAAAECVGILTRKDLLPHIIRRHLLGRGGHANHGAHDDDAAGRQRRDAHPVVVREGAAHRNDVDEETHGLTAFSDS